MHLEGTHTLDAPSQLIWQMLMDPDILAKVTPGVSELQKTGEGVYEAISKVKIGPVKGSFSGTLEVADPVDGESFVLRMKQNSKIGNVAAEGTISLNPLSDAQTEVNFSGDAKLTGTIARTSQRLVSGVAKSMTDKFFKALAEEIQIQQSPDSAEEAES